MKIFWVRGYVCICRLNFSFFFLLFQRLIFLVSMGDKGTSPVYVYVTNDAIC